METRDCEIWRNLGRTKRACLVAIVKCLEAWLWLPYRGMQVWRPTNASVALTWECVPLALNKHLVSDNGRDHVLAETLLLEQL